MHAFHISLISTRAQKKVYDSWSLFFFMKKKHYIYDWKKVWIMERKRSSGFRRIFTVFFDRLFGLGKVNIFFICWLFFHDSKVLTWAKYILILKLKTGLFLFAYPSFTCLWDKIGQVRPSLRPFNSLLIVSILGEPGILHQNQIWRLVIVLLLKFPIFCWVQGVGYWSIVVGARVTTGNTGLILILHRIFQVRSNKVVADALHLWESVQQVWKHGEWWSMISLDYRAEHKEWRSRYNIG